MNEEYEKAAERASILMSQGKYELALKYIKSALSFNPSDASALQDLAFCFFKLKQYDKAKQAIKDALNANPLLDFMFYIEAHIHSVKTKYKEALISINKAINLNPTEAEYHGLLGHIYNNKKEHQEGLFHAEKGLNLDPSNILCLNVRSNALIYLDRKNEAIDSVDSALQYEPEESYSHANKGWLLLNQGNRSKALASFKEALILNPNSSHAKEGLKEAIKAKNPIYSLYLKYLFWMAKFSSKTQWVIIIGFYFGSKFLRVLSRNETLKPFIYPIIIAYAIFALSGWILPSLGNAILFFDKDGRYALEKEEKLQGFVTGVLVLASLALFAFTFFNSSLLLTALAVFCFSICIPFGQIFSYEKDDTYRKIMMGTTLLFVALACLSFYSIITTGSMGTFGFAYLIGIVGFQWAANYFSSKRHG